MEVLHVENLSFKYDNSSFALENISFSLQAGEIMLLSGPSGSGKSTLLKLLKDEIRPAGACDGRIEYSVDKGRVGFLFQNPEAQLVCQTVKEELVFGPENLGLSKESMRRSLAEITAYLGIEDMLDKKVSELSLGQMQIVNLAALLMMKPKVLLLDEPVASLDVVASYDFLKLITKLRDELNLAIIMIEHNIGSIFSEISKVLYLENGREAYAGSAEEFKNYLASGKPYFETMPEEAKLFREVRGEAHSIPTSVKELVRALTDEELLRAVKRADKREVSKDIVVDVKGVYFRYNKADADVLKNISLSIHKGERLALVGGNGAGKSTLFSVLTGYRKPYRGRVKISASVAVLPQNTSYCFSEETLLQDLSVIKPEEEVKAKLSQYPLFEDIGKHLGDNPLDLSGGQMQKAAILKLLLSDAEVILMDEPTTGLDGMDKKNLGNIINTLSEAGKTVVFISHDLEFVEDYADACAELFGGEVISREAAEDFFVGNRFYTTVKGRLRADE